MRAERHQPHAIPGALAPTPAIPAPDVPARRRVHDARQSGPQTQATERGKAPSARQQRAPARMCAWRLFATRGRPNLRGAVICALQQIRRRSRLPPGV